MIGGSIVQIVSVGSSVFIEVMDYPSSLDRCWRKCVGTDFKIGDQIWWQQYEGFLSRKDHFEDRSVGRCVPAEHPENDNVV